VKRRKEKLAKALSGEMDDDSITEEEVKKEKSKE